uniref:Uncharacterized protein n=1 Tax=Moniliophthora roreri TaxID=221103 RepID=A0A0W0FL51_MONRR
MSLLEGFQLVISLSLFMPDFDTYAEFLTFLRPFPALKDIKLRSIKLFGNKPSTESKFAATSITLPATLSPYTSSISWKQMLSKPSLPAQIHPVSDADSVSEDFTLECAIAIGRLLPSSDKSLEEYLLAV